MDFAVPFRKGNSLGKVNRGLSMTKKSGLPGDLISSILCRLPIKDLVRFKMASKSWCSMIEEDQCFINLHANTINHSTLLLEIWEKCDSQRRLFMPHIISAPVAFDYMRNFERLYSNERIVGSCNGLVCLADNSADFGDGALSLLNMAMKERHRIEYQSPPEPRPQQLHNSFGFGYDSVNDDYKVVCVECLRDHNMEDGCFFDQVKTYSLRYDNWSKPRVFPRESLPFKFRTRPMLLVGDSLHCLVVGSDQNYSSCSVENCSILAYDLATEDFHEMSLPESVLQQNCLAQEISLTKLGGCICIVTRSDLDVWVMKDYKRKESWTKLFRIDYKPGDNAIRTILSGRGDKVLFVSCLPRTIAIGWYGLKKKQQKEGDSTDLWPSKVLQHMQGFAEYADVCLETLVSIKAYREGTRPKPPPTCESSGMEIDDVPLASSEYHRYPSVGRHISRIPWRCYGCRYHNVRLTCPMCFSSLL